SRSTPDSPEEAPPEELSPGARVAGPVRVSGWPCTPGAEFGADCSVFWPVVPLAGAVVCASAGVAIRNAVANAAHVMRLFISAPILNLFFSILRINRRKSGKFLGAELAELRVAHEKERHACFEQCGVAGKKFTRM